MLEFTVNNQELKRIDNNIVAANSSKYLQCHFTFITPDVWAGILSAQFTNSVTGKTYIMSVSDNICEVPLEVSSRDFIVSIYAINEATRITSTDVYVPVVQNNFTESAENTSDTTPSYMEQIVSQYVESNVVIDSTDTIVSYETTDIDFTTEL